MTNYGPISEIWFDMGSPTPEQSKAFTETVHTLQPQTMVSGRVFNYEGDFTVMGDNQVPEFQIDEPWQTAESIFSSTWGYRSWQMREDLDGKIRENVDRLARVVSRGGNYILNIGPEGDGSVVPYEADVLKGMGKWLKVNGEAIYGSHPQALRQFPDGYATTKDHTLYLFVKDIPADGNLRVLGLSEPQPQKAHLLGDPRQRELAIGHDDSSLQIKIPDGMLHATDILPVIAVTYTGELMVSPTSIKANADGNFFFDTSTADHFENYNGRGYYAPATLYKLRWNVMARTAKYKVIVEMAGPLKGEAPDVVVNGVRVNLGTPIAIEGGMSITSQSDVASPGGLMAVEVTPHEPFGKGTPLPAPVVSVRLIQASGN
jgi:alpha-L-fucosidase